MKCRALMPLVTYPDPHSAAGMSAAATVARHLGADLHALVLEADIPPVSSALSRLLMNLPEMVLEAEKLSAATGIALLTAASALGGDGLEVTTEVARDQLALIGERAARLARYFDLSLLPWVGGNPTIRLVAEAVLFGSGRPLILLPETLPSPSFDHVAVAWDGSRVAARALADARPFIERAATVSVITVTGEKPLAEKDGGEQLVKALEGAGINASFSPVRAEDCPIAETLQRHAREIGASLLTMGGFGHSRLRDFVLGGATEGVLTDLELPVLLAH